MQEVEHLGARVDIIVRLGDIDTTVLRSFARISITHLEAGWGRAQYLAKSAR